MIHKTKVVPKNLIWYDKTEDKLNIVFSVSRLKVHLSNLVNAHKCIIWIKTCKFGYWVSDLLVISVVGLLSRWPCWNNIVECGAKGHILGAHTFLDAPDIYLVFPFIHMLGD